MIAKEFYGDKLEVLETARTDMLKLLEEFPDDKDLDSMQSSTPVPGSNRRTA